MRARRITAILLCFILAVGIRFGATVRAAEQSETQNVIKLMENLKIVKPGFSVDLDKKVTRGEAVKYIVNILIRNGSSMKGKTPYADVLESDDISSYVNFAAGMGIISEAYNFHPEDIAKYEEVIKMITCGLGFDVVAQDNGGYPGGYILAARMAEIDSVKEMQIGDDVTYRQLFTFLKDTLTAKRFEKTYGTKEKWTITDNTLLSSVYETEILKNAQVLSVDEKKHTVTVKGKEVLTLDLPENYWNEDMVDIFADVWYEKGEKTLLYFDVLRSYEIKYDYIFAVNGSEEEDTGWYPGAVKSVNLYSDNKKYTVNTQDFKIRHNGIEDSNKAVKLLDTFARVVLKDGTIVALETYDLTEGGFFTTASPSRISFRQALYDECYIDFVDTTDSVRVILDGKRVDWKNLPRDSMIDYFQSEDMILIVASTHRKKGNFEAIRDNELVIAGERYNMQNQFGRVFYSYDNGVTYVVEDDKLEAMLNTEITAYLDMYGRVRYVSGIEGKGSIIAMITKMDKGPFGVSSVYLYGNHNGTSGMKKYDLKLSKRSEVKEEDLLNLNDVEDAVFKFEIRGKEIREIENIDWLKADPAQKIKLNSTVHNTNVKLYGEDRYNEVKSDPYIFLGGHSFGRDGGLGRITLQTLGENGEQFERITTVKNPTFIAAYDTLGNINPSMVSWNDFKGCWTDRTFFKAGFSKDNVERIAPDVIYILSNPRFLYRNWDTFGVVTEIESLPDDKYMIELMVPEPKREKYLVNGDELIGEQDGKIPKKGDFIWMYAFGYYEKVNYNAMGEIISDEEAEVLEEAGDYVKKEETYQASGYGKVKQVLDLINDVGAFDNDNVIKYVDNIYSIEGSMMMYRDEANGGAILPIKTKTVIRNQPYIVEGKNRYLMFDYEDFIDQRWETKSYDSLHTIKKSGYSDKLFIFSTGQGRYAKLVLRMPQDYERPGN